MYKIVVDRDTMHWYGEPPCIPCGQQLFSQFEFSMSEDWDNANILAQFKQGGTLLNVAVTENTCYVPYGLNPGTAYLRLRGTFERNSEVIATVNELQFNLVQGFEPGGSPSVPPTPDLYSQLVNQVLQYDEEAKSSADRAEDAADQAKADADRAAEAAIHQPYPNSETGTWWVWDADRGAYVDSGESYSGGVNFTTDKTLKLKNGVLSVNMATEPEPDNTLPITSAAVHTTVGNIEALLQTI